MNYTGLKKGSGNKLDMPKAFIIFWISFAGHLSQYLGLRSLYLCKIVSIVLEFNADKTQLICFGSAVQCTPNVQFLGNSLKFCSTVQHLGHILSHDLSDDFDIIDKTKELAKKANYMLHTFSCCDRLTKSTLFMSFCLSLSGSAIWSLACPQLKSLEVTFNSILCKIWGLPHQYHTSLLHLTCCS